MSHNPALSGCQAQGLGVNGTGVTPLLADRVFLLTGAAGGLGRAQARLLSALGARLILLDLGCSIEGEGSDAGVLDEMRAEFDPERAIIEHGDATHPKTLRYLIELAHDRFGRLDGAVANAGIRRDRALLKMSEDDLQSLLSVQVGGAFHLLSELGKALTERRQPGSIVLIAAPTAFFGAAHQSNLAAAGGAIAGMTRSAAVELRRHAIRLNAIVPTARTRQTAGLPLFQGISPDSMTPDHVAPLVAYLLSSLSADVHGEVVGVAGSRMYALQVRETTGAFAEGRFTPEEIARVWPEINRS